MIVKYESGQSEPIGTVVVVHGAGEHHRRYDWLIKQLNMEGYHVVTGDLPGQGQTEGKRGHILSFDQYIERITSWLIAAEADQLPVVLFGHSMGGLASIRTVTQIDERLLPDMMVLSSPCLGLVNKTSKRKNLMAKMIHPLKPDLYVKSTVRDGTGTRNQDVKNRYATDPLRTKTITLRWYMELLKAMNQAFDDVDHFPDVPLMITQGGDDLIVDKEAVFRWFNALNIRDKSYKEWAGLYHEVINEPERNEVFLHMIGYMSVTRSLQEQKQQKGHTVR
ncbi:alpha/beta hydrolase [Salisediminibacterium beveridgei]|uniref:Lysophospholipase, putative monoglyceride lipase n=1 Tax=Salisediminibacterium beveridgei TaxID=632773 RepID=A0A1D7QSW0_9BACI|nr:alpha/beta hydrolase [Salisediminibacterium beveridgei]AOM82103.1 Lysophospholipase, putative monoglyceride lipase [Salisediminibacterium beveridgei]